MNRDSYTVRLLQQLLAIPSPTGYTKQAILFLKEEAEKMGYSTSITRKGNLHIHIKGMHDSKKIACCAHTDTLGLMVRSIKGNGQLAFTNIGGPILSTLDAEYCTVITRSGKQYSATIISNSPAVHVYKDSDSAPRNTDTMEIRLDEVVYSKEDTMKLGIANGDFIAIDPKTILTDGGFLKSRFLDDKASVGVLYGVLKELSDNKEQPFFDAEFIITTYEETGHGCSWISPDIQELLAVDMGCIGLDLSCTEQDVSICAKDSGGPYDYDMTNDLVDLANKNSIRHAVDIYPFYGSDVGAALRGGNNIRGALIGPGVSASHGMERTHLDALEATGKLVLAYLRKPA